MGLRMKTFIFGAFNENLMFRGAQFTKNGYREGDCPKREALTVCRCKGVGGGGGGGGTWQEREGGVFEGRLIPRCTLCIKHDIF